MLNWQWVWQVRVVICSPLWRFVMKNPKHSPDKERMNFVLNDARHKILQQQQQQKQQQQ